MKDKAFFTLQNKSSVKIMDACMKSVGTRMGMGMRATFFFGSILQVAIKAFGCAVVCGCYVLAAKVI